MNFRDGEQSSEIRSLLSFLRVLSFNLLAHLHRRVLTRGPPQQERFPELFTGQLVNFVPLLFISAVIDSVIHIFSSRFFGFSSPFLFVLRAERPSVIRARPPAVNVVRLVKQTKKKRKKKYIYIYIYTCSGIREQKLGSLSRGHPLGGNTVPKLAIYRSDDATS